ncbi:phage integrase SAM-like domain-containing protein [Phaeodactylibacter sp.]|uniref:phage integrase SAM-like domain-containing protein n=1 Tax=Phaeodactylibacter sp. TaxID=1940289 RepID=UPI0025F93931|nr:phage integrase SAM-like domain-containing protein [Phaeodactylibacter sp.]MCI4649637.1 tyrosine-type recombinase/integrase [Phaeodactylibacter sp.]MCI5092670.1 tyrosine-type recombinase/integrase [Phaeodactylibacter sp.]
MAKLPKPKFYLRLPNGDSETLISLMVSYCGKRLVYSTGYSIHPQDWDAKTQRPIIQTGRADLFEIRRQLDELATHCLNIFIEAGGIAVSLKDFRERLDLRNEKNSTPESLKSDPDTRSTFLEFLDIEVAEMKAAKMKRGSWKVFELHAGRLKKFAADVYGTRGFTYEDVDWNFRLKLIDWLAKQNTQLAYGNKTLKVLRQFLERARRKKLHSHTDYLGEGWVVSKKKAEGQLVTLSNDELGILAEIKLAGFLAKVRDICLIGAGTGQRWSDFSRYSQDHFYRTLKGVTILSVISTKTDTPVKVPVNLFPWLIPVLERNDYATPKMSMQKFNDGLKQLCELAGFDERLLVVEQYFGRKATVKKSFAPKYELVSSHICRRSFATNLYRMGYSLAQIMPMTGHATESQLRKYIGIDGEMNAEEIALQIMQQKQAGTYQYGSGLRIVNG